MTTWENCPNCGAPIKDDVCTYCGTLIYDFATIDLNQPRWVKLKLNNKIVTVRAMLTNMKVTNMNSIPTTFYEDTSIYVYRQPPGYEIDLHMVVMPDDEGTMAKIIDNDD